MTFRDLIYSAQLLSEVARLMHLAPVQAFAWTFEANDLVVVCAEELYDVVQGGTARLER